MDLADKYRPRRFADVTQKHVTRVLEAQIRQDKTVPTYLLSGPPGTGKTTLARIMAMALLCERRPASECEPCGECTSCQQVIMDRHRDVVEVNCATHGGVDEARAMISERVPIAPIKGNYRVFILDENQTLSTQAQNALLKTTEEPPEYVRFFLCTTAPEKVIPAIRTRCQHHTLIRVPDAGVNGVLEKVVKGEALKADPAALGLIVQAANGGVRTAIRILEQVSLIGITEDNVRSVLLRAPRSVALDLLTAMQQNERGTACQLIDAALLEGRDLGALVEECARLLLMMARYRLLKPEVTDPAVLAIAGGFNGQQIIEATSQLLEIIRQLRHNVPADLCVPVGILKVIDRLALCKKEVIK